MSGWLNWRVVGGDFFFMIGDIGGGISCITRCFSRSFCSCSKTEIENCYTASPAILVKATPALSPSMPPTAFALSSSASSAPSASATSPRTQVRPNRLEGSQGQGGIQRAVEPVITHWMSNVGQVTLHCTASMSRQIIARLAKKNRRKVTKQFLGRAGSLK